MQLFKPPSDKHSKGYQCVRRYLPPTDFPHATAFAIASLSQAQRETFLLLCHSRLQSFVTSMGVLEVKNMEAEIAAACSRGSPESEMPSRATQTRTDIPATPRSMRFARPCVSSVHPEFKPTSVEPSNLHSCSLSPPMTRNGTRTICLGSPASVRLWLFDSQPPVS